MLAALVALSAPSLAAAAEVGKPAPDFALPDLDGKIHRLSDLKGRVVVLEWFNPGCPYVVNAHTKDAVVWLAVNSAAPGKQGYGVETNREAARRWSMGHPVLLDEAGATGKAYGATNTPHLFVVGKDGTLVYQGAVDNSPDGERGAPKGGMLVEYVPAALEDLKAGRPLRTAETKAYGCSVKYAN
jgi:peroxiredoxin